MLRDCMARESERGAKTHTSQELHMPFATRCKTIYFIALFILTSLSLSHLSHPLREHTSLYTSICRYTSHVYARPRRHHSLTLSLSLFSFFPSTSFLAFLCLFLTLLLLKFGHCVTTALYPFTSH